MYAAKAVRPGSQLTRLVTYRQLIHLVVTPPAHVHEVSDVNAQSVVAIKPRVAECSGQLLRMVDLTPVVSYSLLSRDN